MLRKFSYLALAALLSFSSILGSGQSLSDSTTINKSLSKTSLTKGTKTGMMKKTRTHKKHHKKTVKKALYKTRMNKSNSNSGSTGGTY